MKFSFLHILVSKALKNTLLLLKWKKNIIYKNLHFIFPDFSEQKIFSIYRNLISNISETATEFLFGNLSYKNLPTELKLFPFKNNNIKFSIEDNSLPIIEKMKKGGVFLTAHFGNYEAIGPWLTRLGIPLKASYASIKPKFLDSFVKNKLRAINGNSYATFIKNPKQILKILDEQKLFCLVADQDYRKKNAMSSIFLGKEVCCNPIPNFILKHRPNTPFYICWILETKNEKILHAIEIKNKDIYKSFHNVLESLIYSQISNWFGWTHRRFLGKENQYTIY
mgnify:FL=1